MIGRKSIEVGQPFLPQICAEDEIKPLERVLRCYKPRKHWLKAAIGSWQLANLKNKSKNEVRAPQARDNLAQPGRMIFRRLR